jgi:hypothetical protein
LGVTVIETEAPGQIEVEPWADAVGCAISGSTVTTTGSEVALQPLESTVVTVYDPPVVTVIDAVVAPFDQR